MLAGFSEMPGDQSLAACPAANPISLFHSLPLHLVLPSLTAPYGLYAWWCGRVSGQPLCYAIKSARRQNGSQSVGHMTSGHSKWPCWAFRLEVPPGLSATLTLGLFQGCPSLGYN